jgi:hypothetical protein
MTKSTTIPNEQGEITIEEQRFFEVVTNHKAMDAFSAVLGKMMSQNKDLFRKEADRRMNEAAPGTTRIAFSDGRGGCVMVSKPDIEKAGTRKKLSAKLLQAVGSVLNLDGCIERVVKGYVTGGLLQLLQQLTKGQKMYLLTGPTMVPWFEGLFTNAGRPIPGPDDGVHQFALLEEELTVDEEMKLTAAAAANFQSMLSEMQAEAPEKLADPKVYDALKALLGGSIKSAPVNVR